MPSHDPGILGAMKIKDYVIVSLAPFALLWIPLVGNIVSQEWHWQLHDFVLFWFILAGATCFYRLLATRKVANFAYKAGAGLAVVTSFLLTWVNLAVQVIGADNPGNLLYFLIILGGMIGVGLSRFSATALATVAFGMAAAVFLVPIIAVLAWPADFNPGFPKVFMLNLGFVMMFVASGLLFRHAASRTGEAIAA